MFTLSRESTIDNLRAIVAGLTLRLFTDDVEPDSAFTLADLTEASGGGYAPIALNPLLWEEAPHKRLAYPKQRFTFTGPVAGGVVHGYYLTRDGKMFGAERFREPWQVQVPGSWGEVSLMLGEKP